MAVVALNSPGHDTESQQIRAHAAEALPVALSAKTVWFALLFVGIACLRIYYCCRLPVNTGDLPRHIYFGLYTAKMGLSAGAHNLVELNPALLGVTWSYVRYNYPIITLLFFALAAKISPTIFFAKFALTLIEAINAAFVFKFTRQPLLALLYWASPLSIWWVSREGQFEPLQNFFVLGALLLLRKNKWPALALLALGIQVKLTAVLLIPFFIFTIRREGSRNLLIGSAVFLAAFTPTFISMLYYSVLPQMFATSRTLLYNPYYWNVLKRGMFGWNPGWLIFCDQIASYGMLVLLAVFAVKRKDLATYFAPICFVALCKVTSLGQFWYFVLFMPFLLPVDDKREKLLLFSLSPLLDLSSLIQILFGPFGYTVGNYYKNVTVFMKHVI